MLHPDGSAYVPPGETGTVSGEHVSWSGKDTYDVDFDRGRVARVPAGSLASSPDWADSLGGPLLVLLAILAVVAGLSYGGLWVGANIGALHPWPASFTNDKTEAGFIVAIILPFPLIGLRLIASGRSGLLWSVILLAGGVTALYTLPGAAEDSLIGSWRHQKSFAAAQRVIERTLSDFEARSPTQRCGMIDPHFRQALYGGWSKCLRYETGKQWAVSFGSTRVTDVKPGIIYGWLYTDTTHRHAVSLIKERGHWRIALADFRELLSPPSWTRSTRVWRPPIYG
jgi:hypothetical protein